MRVDATLAVAAAFWTVAGIAAVDAAQTDPLAYTREVLQQCSAIVKGSADRKQKLTQLNDLLRRVMLALESSEVIGLRVAKLAQGGSEAQNEAHLLVNEKIVAVFDAGMRLVCGATTSHVIDGFREQVAANALRLSTERQPALGQE